MRRLGLRVRGTVQGVGFRPFVHRVAGELGLSGTVLNDGDGVWCEVQGAPDAVNRFVERLATEGPPLADVTQLIVRELSPIDSGGTDRFTIEPSPAVGGPRLLSVPADVAPCAACRRELFDPADRRFGYPFTCCVDCGPRYTVVDAVPYDRARTSMAAFPLCATCEREYAEPTDRRHHAQATCCGDCGPRLWLWSDGGDTASGDGLAVASQVLVDGGIVALKGVGGYQLLCRADREAAVRRLRAAKRREEKPFALLASGLAVAEGLVALSDLDRRALSDPSTPIVLAPRRADGRAAAIADSVAPDTDLLGVMLPSSPLHLLLSRGVGQVLVCTSGNRSDEPIVIDDDDAITELGGIVDVILGHNRRIARRADDSVGRTINGTFQVLRRARGLAPRAIRLPSGEHEGRVVLAVGAELKNTVGLAIGGEALLSVHLGDLDHPRAILAFEQAVADLVELVGRGPDLVAHDLHPEYLSTKFALAAELAPTVGVQHHHAHLASCLVDNGWSGERGPVLGVTFDGLGLGTDGNLWGGEFLLGGAGHCERVATLRSTPMPGGEAAIREPWRMAVSHLHSAGLAIPGLGALADADEAVDTVAHGAHDSAPPTTSMGRLFDAVAALCGVPAGRSVNYEGQAAIQLEQLARRAVSSGLGGSTVREVVYPFDQPLPAGVDAAPLVLDQGPMLAAVVADLVAGTDPAVVAARFHNWLAELIAQTTLRIGHERFTAVALTGGVFQNRLLAELATTRLQVDGLTVLTQSQVPPNDGGIALGQLAVARAARATPNTV